MYRADYWVHLRSVLSHKTESLRIYTYASPTHVHLIKTETPRISVYMDSHMILISNRYDFINLLDCTIITVSFKIFGPKKPPLQ